MVMKASDRSIGQPLRIEEGIMARKSGEMQATGPLFDQINRKVADTIGEAIEQGADHKRRSARL